MFRDICSSIYHNKNFLMLATVGIYILSLFGTLSGFSVLSAFILTILLIICTIKDYFPLKIIIIWALIFYFGIINTSFRIKESDELLNLAPVNSTIYGKIISVPQTKDSDKTRFFFGVNKIEYDNKAENFENEKILVTLNTKDKLNIYDSYKIRGRLSPPFKAGNPSQFDYGYYLRNFGTYAVFYGRNPYSMKDLDMPCYEKLPVNKTFKERTLQKINNARDVVMSVHRNYIKSPNLEILGGIVFGDDAVSPPENIKQSFVNSGLLHILAASGMNVAFIYSFFFFLLNFCRVPFRINIGICILAVITYVFMTGLGASVIRAALMLLFVLIGKLVDRDAHSISLLSFVAFLMLIYNPMYINDVGFQLSFVVTFGLLVMTPYLINSKHRFVNWIIGSVTVPVIAQLWVIPIQIFYFNNISIYSVFANIMSVPILYVISFGGFISSVLTILSIHLPFNFAHFICQVFDFILSPLITILVNISDFWGSIPNSTLQTTHPNPFQILIYYLTLINITYMFDKNIRENFGKYFRFSIPALISVLLISTISIPNHNLEITAFDAGNADAFMIKTPDNKYMMIDTGKSGFEGGKSQAEVFILKYFKDKGIKNLDTIIVTHFDNDHSGGAADLINTLNVNKIYVNKLNDTSASSKTILSSAHKRNTEIIEAKNGQIVYDNSGVKITNFILKDIAGIGDNESSIITLVKYNDFSMLFTGDAGIKTLNKLKLNIPQNITILKVGHHGASGVINRDLAKYINPEYSIVSTGENKFGHPSIYTLETLRNSKILRTDINNSIKICINNKNYKIFTYNPSEKKYTQLNIHSR